MTGMWLKLLYFVSAIWVVLLLLVLHDELVVAAVFSLPGLLGLLVCYLKTGRFLLPPK